jgi:hypothetical protein
LLRFVSHKLIGTGVSVIADVFNLGEIAASLLPMHVDSQCSIA